VSSTVKIPSFDEMMWPTLEALKNSGGSASNQELLVQVTQLMNLSDEVQSFPYGDGPRTEVEYRLLWARTYLRKVGAIGSCERGVWSITSVGRALTAADMKSIVVQVREMK
jgi:restriction system protein